MLEEIWIFVVRPNKSPQNYVTFTKHKDGSVCITLSAEFSSSENFGW